MINFDYLESNSDDFREIFSRAKPFEHLVVDEFCDSEKLCASVKLIQDPHISRDNKSRDFVFAKNKYEKARFEEISKDFAELRGDLISPRFAEWLSGITGQTIFIDPDFHGGGLHQGGAGSFLDMHADFNYHPKNPTWFRNVNILLYLNDGWKSDHGGMLKLQNGRSATDALVYEIDPLFNRAVIMFTREHTLHGYEPINFPVGTFRRSVAAYGYTLESKPDSARTTIWHPKTGGILKKFLGKNMPLLVKIKTKFLGSSTSKNK